MKSTGKKRASGMGEGSAGSMPSEASDQGMPSGGMGADPGGGDGMPTGSMEAGAMGGGMPSGGMDAPRSGNGMSGGSSGGMTGSAAGGMRGADQVGGPVGVLVELRMPAAEAGPSALAQASGFGVSGFQVDPEYPPIPMGTGPETAEGFAAAGEAEPPREQTVIVRGTIPEEEIPRLEAREEVVKVWRDAPIQPFGPLLEETGEVNVQPMIGFGVCPIGTCDCQFDVAKGTIADVATYLGVPQIWAAGIKGDTIVVGVVDGGITASGRTINPSDTSATGWPAKLIPRVIGGWPAGDWGTTGVAWGWHGNMCATDVLGMAPNAQVYDIRISAGGISATISAALAGFQWAIDRHKADGTPQILTNSWGMYQQSWAPDYATDPNHPFTRKVVDALNEGILVLFAAGNCGGACPDGRCGSDAGPGKSIWGANSHPRVMTVGAVNKNEQFVGYSSQGPGALDPQKPDFCSITHFQGFFPSDNGTSAATPIAAGVVALLKQANPGLTQEQVKTHLKSTAKDIGPAGWDQHSGSGILRAKAAFDASAKPSPVSGPVVSWGTDRLDVFVLGTNRALYHKWWNGSAWGPSVTGYEFMGGICSSRPDVVSWGPNRLDVFLLGTDSALYHKWWNGSAWGPSLTGYEFMGGVCLGEPKAVAWGPNRLDVFVLGTNSALYHKWWNGSAWGPSVTGWEYMGGVCSSPPRVVAWGPNRLDVFVTGTDSALYHKWWNGSAWGPSVTGWEAMGGTIVDF